MTEAAGPRLESASAALLSLKWLWISQCGHCLVTLSLTIKLEALKWLSGIAAHLNAGVILVATLVTIRAPSSPAAAFWIWICTLQGPFLAIFATELGERNANITILLKKNSLCGFTVPLFQVFKNWLKRISALTAYVWGAAPCSALPTASDENAVYCDYSMIF